MALRMVMKKVLLLCGSHNDLGVMLALKKLGYYIIVTGNKDLPADKFADKKIIADYSNKELVLSIAVEEKIDFVCQCCNDFGVYTAAFVAEKLGIKGYDTYENTLLLHNKDKFKSFIKSLNILSPISDSYNSYEKAISNKYNYKLPIIVKPVDCSAGNGVSVVYNYDDFCKAVKMAFSFSKEKKIVVEKYLNGTQHGFCTFLINQKVVAISSNNEYSIVNPYRVEIDTFPSTTYDDSKDILINAIELIASKLKLTDGIFHLQYIFCDGKPYIIEVMRRTLGNMYSVLSNKLNNLDWDYWEARALLGLSLQDFPKNNFVQEGYYAYKTIVAKKNGKIERIIVSDKLKSHVFEEYFLLNEGDDICDFKKQPIGFLFLIFSSQEEMHRTLIEDYDDGVIVSIS